MRNDDDNSIPDSLLFKPPKIVIREVPPEEVNITNLLSSCLSYETDLKEEDDENICDDDSDLPTETSSNNSDDNTTESTLRKRSMLLLSIIYHKVVAIVNPPNTSSSSLPTSSEENESGNNEVLLPFEVSQIPDNHSISVENDTQDDGDKTQPSPGFIYFGVDSRRL